MCPLVLTVLMTANCAGLRIDPAQANFYLEQARGDIKEAIRLQSASRPHATTSNFRPAASVVACASLAILTARTAACRRRCKLGAVSATMTAAHFTCTCLLCRGFMLPLQPLCHTTRQMSAGTYRSHVHLFHPRKSNLSQLEYLFNCTPL